MDDRFGARLSSWDNPIMMYRPFNGTAGLIFKVSILRIWKMTKQIVGNLKKNFQGIYCRFGSH